MLTLIDEAVAGGARLSAACDILNISTRSVDRWRTQDGGEDRRRGPRTAPGHKLTPSEREAVLAAANCAEFRDKSPRQIVPTLADRGEYIASESTFLSSAAPGQTDAISTTRTSVFEQAQLAHRACTEPGLVLGHTYLRSARRGEFYYQYVILDVYSRKVVGWWGPQGRRDARTMIAAPATQRNALTRSYRVST